jgi:hypothetical protein
MVEIQEARNARISNWVDVPFTATVSNYKYLILLPPKKPKGYKKKSQKKDERFTN